MTEPVLSRVAEARTFLSKLWKLAAPYWWSEDNGEIGIGRFRVAMPERWIARGLLRVDFLLGVFSVYLSKLFNDWNGRFFNACRRRTRRRSGSRFAYFVDSGVHLHRRGGLSHLAAPVSDDPLAALADRRLYPHLARRQHLLSDGANWHGSRQSRAADRAGHRRFHHEHALSDLDFISEVISLVTFTVILWNLSGTLVVPMLGGVAFRAT